MAVSRAFWDNASASQRCGCGSEHKAHPEGQCMNEWEVLVTLQERNEIMDVAMCEPCADHHIELELLEVESNLS